MFARQERVCVIFNPTAKGERAKRTLKRLEAVKGACGLKPTLAAGMARPLASEAVREGFETIVAMGGDGTVNEVLNGMVDEPGGLAQSRLAVLPVGTVNVFARELGVPSNFAKAWDLICQGSERLIDLPEVRFHSRGERQCRCFAQMAGSGLDARAVELVEWTLKKKIGQFAYIVAGLKALRERMPLISVMVGGEEYRGELVLLGNGRLYGGPVPLFERADLEDGLLDVCVFPKINWFVIMRYALAYLSPKLLRRGCEHHLQTAKVVLKGSGNVPLELDGELVGQLPAECVIRRKALRVVVP